jgi:hypothetical protein
MGKLNTLYGQLFLLMRKSRSRTQTVFSPRSSLELIWFSVLPLKSYLPLFCFPSALREQRCSSSSDGSLDQRSNPPYQCFGKDIKLEKSTCFTFLTKYPTDNGVRLARILHLWLLQLDHRNDLGSAPVLRVSPLGNLWCRTNAHKRPYRCDEWSVPGWWRLRISRRWSSRR